MRLLARREHAELELKRKLHQREFADDEIESALSELKQRGWQSDERFAEMLIGSRARRGQGPVKISQALQSAGIAKAALQSSDVDWDEQALVAIRRYLRNKDVSQHEVRMKAMRHLLQKGFTTSSARVALAAFLKEPRESDEFAPE
jgi:regulatory protein